MKIKALLTSMAVVVISCGVLMSEAATLYENPVSKFESYQVNFVYDDVNTEHEKVQSQFTYNDGYFLQDATKLNGEIAKMSVALAATAYDIDDITSVLTNSKADGGMGFTIENYDTQSISYDDSRLSLYDNDHVAYTIASKRVNGYMVYCVPVRGTGPNAEWFSDFNLGEDMIHEGFNAAASELYDDLSFFLDNDGVSSLNTIVLLTGHSRGAAVTNIVAGWLDDDNQIPDNQIFGYTFACPGVSLGADHSLRNIYNFNNPGDLITLLPMEDWGYERNGIDIDVYSGTLPTKDNVYYQFDRISSIDCRSEDNPYTYLNLIRTLIPDKDTFMKTQYQVLFRFIAYVLGGKNNVENPWDMISYNNYELLGVIAVTLLKLQNDFKNGNILDNVYKFFVDYNLNVNESYEELIRACDSWLKTDNLDIDHLGTTLEGRRINDLVQVNIKSEADIYLAKSKMQDLLTRVGCLAKDNMSMISLFISPSGNIIDSITHGHVQFFYVSLINSLFLGYRGWYYYNSTAFELCGDNSFDGFSYNSIMDIGEECFSNSQSIKSVILPENLYSIQKLAFYECRDLSGEVDLPVGIRTIGEQAFYYCQNITGKIAIPDGVKEIKDNSFALCSNIVEVIIPESVRKIGKSSFIGDSRIQRLTIPCYTEFDTTYNDSSFGELNQLEYVSITGSGSSIDFSETSVKGPWSYSKTDELVIEVSEGITRIGDYYFYGCGNLKELNIPSTVKEIGNYAYCSCNNSDTVDACKLNLPKGLESIGEYAFYYCHRINGDINLPEGLTYIGDYAFLQCESLTGEVVIPEGITEINKGVFSCCSSISKATIHNGVISLGDGAFSYCSSLKDLTIPGTNFVIENDTVFKKCDCINYVLITGQGEMVICKPDTYSYFYDLDIKYCTYTPWYISTADSIEVEISDGITSIQNYAFALCGNLTSINIPSTVTKIGDAAYFDCSKASGRLVLPSGLTEIGVAAFADCKNLSELDLPSKVRKIGMLAFYNCESLTGKLVIPDGVKKIEYRTFMNCDQIEEIVIPKSVTSIGQSAFSCRNLKRLTIPCSASFDFSSDNSSFDNPIALEYVSITGSGSTLDFTEKSSKGPWSHSKTDELVIELAEGITRIGDYYFYGCGNLKELNIPSTVKEIGDYAYCSCNNSDTVDACKLNLPKGLESIGEYAFYYCHRIYGDINLPEGLTYIGDYAFLQCESLTGEVVIPGGIEDLNVGAFAACTNITKLTIQIGVKTIGSGSFSECGSIESITIPCNTEYVKSGDSRSFYRCPAIDSAIIIHDEVVDDAVEPGCVNTGLTEGLHCSLCGQVFVAQEEVAATGHKPVTDDAVAPDCTHSGLTEGSHCSVCGEVLVAQEEVAATGHKAVTDPGKDPTYSETGLTEGSHCSVCGEILVPQEVIPALTPEHVGWYEEDGNKYYYDEEGTKVTGWQKIEDSWYYLDPSTGAMTTGWQQSGGSWYYLEPGSGVMKTGWLNVNGKWYYLNTSGVMQSGWQKISNTWYYFNSAGVMETGWVKTGGSWYYFENSGAMVKGWKQIGKTWYYFKDSGSMASGWMKISSKWYYFAVSGAMVTDWIEIDKIWYYFERSGAMVTGWKEIGGKSYYFASSGEMLTGWKSIDGEWYYFESSGQMATGWLEIGGKWYYFFDTGIMASDTVIDGYYINKDGVWVK